MPELSIIVPVYKVEPYLSKCLDSILAQTFTDFELILIDDGSPDRCGEICDEFAARDSRIIVIHQENQGVSAARNAGLDIAAGEYIGFVDSDDWIEPEMYAAMLNEKQTHDVDVVFCKYTKCSEKGLAIEALKTEKTFFQDTEDLLGSLFKKPLPTGGVCWNTLLPRHIIGETRFINGVAMKEDILFLFDVFTKCRSGYLMPDAYYCFRQQNESATRKNVSMALYQTLPSNWLLIKRARAWSRDLERQAVDKGLDDGIRFLRFVKADETLTDRRQKRKILFSLNWFYIRLLFSALVRGILSKQMFNRYVYEFLHL